MRLALLPVLLVHRIVLLLLIWRANDFGENRSLRRQRHGSSNFDGRARFDNICNVKCRV